MPYITKNYITVKLIYIEKFFFLLIHILFTHIIWVGVKVSSPLVGALYIWMLSLFYGCRLGPRSKSQRLQPEGHLPAKNAREHAPLHWSRVPQTYDSQVQTLETGIPFLRLVFSDIAV